MTETPQPFSMHNLISDLRAAIDKHFADAGKDVTRITQGETFSPNQSDQMWALFLAFHSAVVDWTIDQGMKDDKIKASVLVDIGMRMFLDHIRDSIMQAEAKKPKKPAIYLQQ